MVIPIYFLSLSFRGIAFHNVAIDRHLTMGKYLNRKYMQDPLVRFNKMHVIIQKLSILQGRVPTYIDGCLLIITLLINIRSFVAILTVSICCIFSIIWKNLKLKQHYSCFLQYHMHCWLLIKKIRHIAHSAGYKESFMKTKRHCTTESH